MPLCCVISQVRAVYRNGLDVSAPTGHRSITLPDNSEAMLFSIYVPISMNSLRPVAPSSRRPAISSPKRTQRVQWIHRVMSVCTRGPMFLSCTTRFFSW